MLDSELQERTFRCPTCGAEQSWCDVCRRCRCDLALLHATVRTADDLYQHALRSAANRRIADAFRAARQSCELNPCPRSQRLLAVCALLGGQWQVAAHAAETLRRNPTHL